MMRLLSYLCFTSRRAPPPCASGSTADSCARCRSRTASALDPSVWYTYCIRASIPSCIPCYGTLPGEEARGIVHHELQVRTQVAERSVGVAAAKVDVGAVEEVPHESAQRGGDAPALQPEDAVRDPVPGVRGPFLRTAALVGLTSLAAESTSE